MLAAEETAYVPSIFSQQGLRLIFRMTLKINEKTSLVLLDKAVHASVVRFAKDFIAAFGESIFMHFIPSGMRDSQRSGMPGIRG